MYEELIKEIRMSIYRAEKLLDKVSKEEIKYTKRFICLNHNF